MRLKKFLSKNSFLSILTARAHSIIFGMISLFYRVAFYHRSYIAFSAKVIGWKSIKLGKNVVISAGSWINVNDRNTRNPKLYIESNSFIGRNNFITVGRLVHIGEFVLTGTNCSFICSSHNISNVLLPYSVTGVTNSSDIKIETNVFIGANVTVLGNVTIGYGSVVGANSFVTKNIPPFSIVHGNPAKIIKRFDFKNNCWTDDLSIDDFCIPRHDKYKEILRNNLTQKYPFQPLSVSRTYFGDLP
jgi:acetyltransferase-like isoleucine patch superfamily enzyme